MPRPSCLPCCNPTEMSRSKESFMSALLQILCAQQSTSVMVMCNTNAEPVIVRVVIDPVTDTPTLTAWSTDGTLYEGDLTFCNAT